MFRYGFRVLGSVMNPRRLVDWEKAFDAYCRADPQAEPQKPAWLSAYRFGEGFADYLSQHGTVKGFDGAVWTPWLWFDVDAQNLRAAICDTTKLIATIEARYKVPCGSLPVWFSGSKGFHVAVPLTLHGSPEPSSGFHRTLKALAIQLAEEASVSVDTAIYDKVRLLRAPNSLHEKSGKYKVPVSVEELQGPLEAILAKASTPVPFGMPQGPPAVTEAVRDWERATAVGVQSKRPAAPTGRLNRHTVELIRGKVPPQGDRHRLLFSAAADLAEKGTPEHVVFELLTEPGLDSGLPPSEVRRQISCGFAHGRRGLGATVEKTKLEELQEVWRASPCL